MSDNNFSRYDTDILLTIRENLLGGLTKVEKSIQAGSFHKVGSKGEAPPSQSGQTTLALLLSIQEVLTERGHHLTW